MWVRKRLDIGWRDLAFGVSHCLWPVRGEACSARIAALWSGRDLPISQKASRGNDDDLPFPRGEGCFVGDETLCCLSVRSGWDLLLTALDLPAGSEVLVSALTIPDMVAIIEEHGLVAVPVDLDPARLELDLDRLEQAITPASKVILFAHLFGTRIDVGPLVELARRHGLLLVEDCAQAFMGLPDSAHHGCANRGSIPSGRDSAARGDVEMYSFGTIKTATALGGAVLRVRDATLRARIDAAQQNYPLQSRWAYLRRLIKYAGLKSLTSRVAYRLFVQSCRLVGVSHDRVASSAVRGFAGPGFFQRIRRRPSAPLLALLERRLRCFDHAQLARRAQQGEQLRELLQGVVAMPGEEAQPHTHWVFPALIEPALAEKSQIIARLSQAGFDATCAQSLRLVEPPPGREELDARQAGRMLQQIVYLPCYPAMTDGALAAMAAVLRADLPAPAAETAPRRVATACSAM